MLSVFTGNNGFHTRLTTLCVVHKQPPAPGLHRKTENISDAQLQLNYTFHRTTEKCPLETFLI